MDGATGLLPASRRDPVPSTNSHSSHADLDATSVSDDARSHRRQRSGSTEASSSTATSENGSNQSSGVSDAASGTLPDSSSDTVRSDEPAFNLTSTEVSNVTDENAVRRKPEQSTETNENIQG